MTCDCACHPKLVHLKAEVADLAHKIELLERDMAREVTDRQADVRLLRRNLAEFGGAL